MYQIVFYKDEKGRSEVEEYIKELRIKEKSNKDNRIKYEKIDIYLNLLTKYGLNLGETYIKHLEKNRIILLTHFIKNTRKTPRREIKRAERLLKIIKEGD